MEFEGGLSVFHLPRHTRQDFSCLPITSVTSWQSHLPPPLSRKCKYPSWNPDSGIVDTLLDQKSTQQHGICRKRTGSGSGEWWDFGWGSPIND